MLKFMVASSVLAGAGLLLHASPPPKSPYSSSTGGAPLSCSSSFSRRRYYRPFFARPAFAEELKSSSSYPRSATGVREKKIAFVAVKAYAVGFYANKEQLPNDWDKNFLVEGAFEKGLVVKLARDVSGALFSSALNDELKPRLKSSPEGEKILSEFGKLFQNRKLKKDGETPATPNSTFVSGFFASRLFDVYLGEKSVSPSLKASIADHLHDVIPKFETNGLLDTGFTRARERVLFNNISGVAVETFERYKELLTL
ncbi:fatty-acid-binding protein 3, chloroplastic [Selaginella moellendorffii]|uniref:fatty-acid-binding protein 3, chloroplastic n=1 Tax=Selaginella moellendorffii TaxID=88036 RepID=UPI000D1C8AA0|nr:fatty-acid-binding protein 3, chloroplastic [Selaginella moellendorffii]|eukprot:XP_024522851.1 fatty-acid-binding protein 3, chloroplastic [Selaginella moellendorffii]